MTDDFAKVLDTMTAAAAEPEDYTGEDGLLYCGSCHTPKQFRMDKPPMEGRLLPRRCSPASRLRHRKPFQNHSS